MTKKPKTALQVDVEALLLSDQEGALNLPLFDDSFYNHQLPQFTQQPDCAFTHFLNIGEKLGLLPHPVFDREYVLAQARGARVKMNKDFSPFLYVLENDL